MDDAPLRLRPGLAPVRRDDRHLQVGLDAPRRAILPDTAEVRRLLASLATGLRREPSTLPARRALAVLREAGLLEPALAPPVLQVAVDASAALAAHLARVLAAAGLVADAGAGVVLVLADGPVARDRVDPLMRAGTPHLVVEGGPDGWSVGPFVVPGATACLRCVDAHRAEGDPRRAMVLEQLARLPAAAEPHGRLLALTWAVGELRAYLTGQLPGAWSATYRLSPGCVPEQHVWLRHPHCGCAWDLLVDAAGSPPG